MESGIIRNLEERLSPIPKKDRVLLKRGKKLDAWIRHIQEPTEFTFQERMRLDACAISLYSSLLDSLSTAENKRLMKEMMEYFRKKKENKEIKSNHDFFRDNSWWLSEISNIVDGMLGVKIQMPKIAHNPKGDLLFSAGDYAPLRRVITTNGNLAYDLPEVVAHEYIHHIQYSLKCQIRWAQDLIMKEGMAYNLGRNAILEYAEKSGNYKVYASAAAWAHCHLSKTLELLDETREERRTCRERDSEHYPGIAAFMVAEARHGKKIYREIIRSNNPAKYILGKLK